MCQSYVNFSGLASTRFCFLFGMFLCVFSMCSKYNKDYNYNFCWQFDWLLLDSTHNAFGWLRLNLAEAEPEMYHSFWKYYY